MWEKLYPWSTILRDGDGGGGSGDPSTGKDPGDPGQTGGSTGDPSASDDLTKLKAALEAERRQREAAEKARKALEKKMADAEEAGKSEHEKALEKARNEGRLEAVQAGNRRLVEAEIRAAAAGKFKNPALAVKLLDVDAFLENLGDDGSPDTKAIEAAIDKFLADNPELKGKPPAPESNGRQMSGSSGAPAEEPKNSKEWAELAFAAKGGQGG